MPRGVSKNAALVGRKGAWWGRQPLLVQTLVGCTGTQGPPTERYLGRTRVGTEGQFGSGR